MVAKLWISDRDRFIVDLLFLRDRAGRLELWRTMHELDKAAKEVGYECADIATGKQKCSSEHNGT